MGPVYQMYWGEMKKFLGQACNRFSSSPMEESQKIVVIHEFIEFDISIVNNNVLYNFGYDNEFSIL